MRRRWRLSLIMIGGLAVPAGLAILLPGCVELATQAALLPGVERRIGAEIRAPWVNAGDDVREVITFAAVAPRGVCARAGIVSGDIVVSNPTIGGLCKRLNGSPGQQVGVEIVAGGDGPPIERRARRRVIIELP